MTNGFIWVMFLTIRNVSARKGPDMLGWRKLGAWVLVYAFVVAATFMVKDISDNALDLTKWVTAFFFGANAIEHAVGKIKVNVGTS